MSIFRKRIRIPSRLCVTLPGGQIFLRNYYLRAAQSGVSLRTLNYLCVNERYQARDIGLLAGAL